MGKHLYLFTLELVPMEIGAIYHELPLHSTLMHRFWADLSVDELTNKTIALFDKTPPITLTAYERAVLGPEHMTASLLELTKHLSSLNMQLYRLLNELGVKYTAPQWVGERHTFHVTDRGKERLGVNSHHLCKAAYLIEVGTTEHERKRIVRRRFELKGKLQGSYGLAHF